MASLTRWMWVWENSGSWRWTGRPSVLQFMGPQRVGHDWATELTDWLMLEWVDFPSGSVVESQPANAGYTGDAGLICGTGRYPGGANVNPLQYFRLENSMVWGVWWAIGDGVAKESDTTWGLNNNNNTTQGWGYSDKCDPQVSFPHRVCFSGKKQMTQKWGYTSGMIQVH